MIVMETANRNPHLWLQRVLGWDGIMPLSIVLLPFGIRALLPNNDDAICIVAIVVPIVAFLIRYTIGRRNIASNQVGPIIHRCQYIVFTLAILLLLLMDVVIILLQLAPQVPRLDVIILGAVYGVYLLAMSFAMYPGNVEASGPDLGD